LTRNTEDSISPTARRLNCTIYWVDVVV